MNVSISSVITTSMFPLCGRPYMRVYWIYQENLYSQNPFWWGDELCNSASFLINDSKRGKKKKVPKIFPGISYRDIGEYDVRKPDAQVFCCYIF